MAKDRTLDPSSDHYRDYGIIAALCTHSDTHKRWSANDLMRLFMAPILLNQYRIFYDYNRPVGFVTWALFGEDAVNAYVERTRKLQPLDFHSGDQVWVIDLVAPFGGTREIVRAMR
ncbi:MAG: toxin-activating lysine-acyltransferase, partial [Candidatus Poseidoniales archaeon]